MTMTDFMLIGTLRMPIEADDGVVAFTQFRSAARSAADRIEALTADNARLRAAFRVNMLRFVPGVTHADIDAVISAALNTGKEANG
jgi:hypothetical protein